MGVTPGQGNPNTKPFGCGYVVVLPVLVLLLAGLLAGLLGAS